MGNQIEELPEALGNMVTLRILLVANNRLKALPTGILKLKTLEWIFAYDNAIVDLPAGLLTSCRWLERVLFEANPLSFECLRTLFEDASRGRCKTVGLDTTQVRDYRRHASDAG